MPCSKGGSTESLNELLVGVVSDWARVHPYVPHGTCKPTTRADLVALIREIEAKGRIAKAVGSVWALSRAAEAPKGFVIYTDCLHKHLSRPFFGTVSPAQDLRPLPGMPCADDFVGQSRFAMKEHDDFWLDTLDPLRFLSNPEHSLVHVQAGVKIADLLADLSNVDLALPTMGAAGGQSLAGAVSTGTHGGDVALPPIGDFVRAVHLIGPGGQEFWIEGDGGATTSVSYSQLPDWCDDTKVIRDSDFLHSVLVGVGRFGVIYSVILEVVPQYRLLEQRDGRNLSDVRGWLISAASNGYNASGEIFADPREGHPLRFYSVIVDLWSGEDCYVWRRWVTDEPFDQDVDQGGGFFGCLCGANDWALSIVLSITQTVVNLLHGEAIKLGATYGWIPFAGPALASDAEEPYLLLAEDLISAALDFSSLGDWLATVIDRVRYWNNEAGGFPDFVMDALQGLIGDIWTAVLGGDQGSPRIRVGPSEKILDTHNYSLDGCFHVDSSEFFFDANSTGYVDFVDAVLGTSQAVGSIPGVAALRFLKRTRATIGMEQFARTVSVEVGFARPSSVNAKFKKAIQEIALGHGGIPHWGQEHTLNRAQVEGIYGSRRLEDWRWAVAETEAPSAGTFSSPFTRNRGLEPIDKLVDHRARRYVGAATSGTIGMYGA